MFQTISQNAAPDAVMLAAGIWEALITTIMGLCVAIPMLTFYYFLLLKFKSFHIEAVEHSYRALELCQGPEARAARARKGGPPPRGRRSGGAEVPPGCPGVFLC